MLCSDSQGLTILENTEWPLAFGLQSTQAAVMCNTNILKWVSFPGNFFSAGPDQQFCQHVLVPLNLHTVLCIGDKSLPQWQKSCAKDTRLQSNTALISSARVLLFRILSDHSRSLVSDLSVPVWWAPTTIPYSLLLINLCYRRKLILLIWIYSGISQSREILDQDMISRDTY